MLEAETTVCQPVVERALFPVCCWWFVVWVFDAVLPKWFDLVRQSKKLLGSGQTLDFDVAFIAKLFTFFSLTCSYIRV